MNKTLKAFVLSFANTVLSGLTTAMLWKWFVAGVFGLPTITFLQALGLFLLVRYLTNKPVVVPPKRGAELVEAMGKAELQNAIISVYCLVFGFFIAQFL